MDMGWESFSETMDREDGFIDVLVWQGDSRRGADHDVPGDKRGLRMLVWSGSFSLSFFCLASCYLFARGYDRITIIIM